MTTSRCTSDQKSSMTEYVVLDRERKGSAPSTGWTVHWIGRSLLLARPRLGPPDTSAQRRRFWRCRVVSPATIFNIRQIFWFPSAALSGTMRLFKLRRTDLKGQQRSQLDLPTWHACLCAESDPLLCIDLGLGKGQKSIQRGRSQNPRRAFFIAFCKHRRSDFKFCKNEDNQISSRFLLQFNLMAGRLLYICQTSLLGVQERILLQQLFLQTLASTNSSLCHSGRFCSSLSFFDVSMQYLDLWHESIFRETTDKIFAHIDKRLFKTILKRTYL